VAITVQSGVCAVTHKEVFALYDGDLPVIPATVYLRHLAENRQLTPNTIQACAYALSVFFTFLESNRRSFWDLTPAVIKQFKRFHLSRQNEDGNFAVKRTTARQYLNAVKGLIRHWRRGQDNDPFFIDQVAEIDGRRKRRRGRGYLRHASWYSPLEDDLWHINIPETEMHNKSRYKGLSAERCRAVMLALNRGGHHTELETMLYYRDRAIWTFLLISGLRKGELVRIRLEDANPVTGVITLKDRQEDAWLSDLKTGPGEVFVSTHNPYWRHLDSWLTEGRWIAEEILKARGIEDHGMLFCNRDGGPLTQAAVDHLFSRLKESCTFGPGVPFYPHITRHTIATVMINSGVELTEVQKFLRHRCIQSTEIYSKISDAKLRQSLSQFWEHFKEFE
jgi:site-specific recombinase XerD